MYDAFSIERFYRILSRNEIPQKLTQLRPRSHPRHLVGKRTAQKDAIEQLFPIQVATG